MLLREALRDTLPEKVRTRSDKADFGKIVQEQLAIEKSRLPRYEETFTGIVSNDLWNAREALHAKKAFKNNEDFLEWKLINLHCWYQRNF